MADLGSVTFSQTDANNASGTMPSWSGSAAPSTIDDAGRALQGAVTREWTWRNYTLTAGGSANAKTLTFSVTPAAYYDGQRFAFIANTTNTSTVSLNVNGLGAKAIKKLVAGVLTDLASGDMPVGSFVEVAYNSSNNVFAWVNQIVTLPQGLATTDTPQFAGLEVGNASDTTLTRSAAGILAVEGNRIISAAGSAAQGDVLYFDGTAWVRLGPGTSGQYLKTQGAAANPAWATVPTITLLGTVTTTSGTSQQLASLTLTSYKFLRVVFNGVSHNSGTSQSFSINTVAVTTAVGSGATPTGMIDIELSTGVASCNVGSNPLGGVVTTVKTDTTTLTFAPSGGSFDAGSITVYGIS